MDTDGLRLNSYYDTQFDLATGLDVDGILRLFGDLPRADQGALPLVRIGNAVEWELKFSKLGSGYPGRLTSGRAVDAQVSFLAVGRQYGQLDDWLDPLLVVFDRLLGSPEVFELDVSQSSEPVCCSWDGERMLVTVDENLSPELVAGVFDHLQDSGVPVSFGEQRA